MVRSTNFEVDRGGFTFKNRIWLQIIIAVLEMFAVFGAWKMKQLEKTLNEPPARRRSAGR